MVGLPAASINRPSSIATFLLLATRTLPIATWLVAKSSTIGFLPLRGTAYAWSDSSTHITSGASAIGANNARAPAW